MKREGNMYPWCVSLRDLQSYDLGKSKVLRCELYTPTVYNMSRYSCFYTYPGLDTSAHLSQT